MDLIRELMMIEASTGLSGSGQYELYHDTYTEAVQAALEMARNRGYHLDDAELFREIGSGPRKPSEGDTNSISLTLYIKGRAVSEKLHLQVYNRGTDKYTYELNAYIA